MSEIKVFILSASTPFEKISKILQIASEHALGLKKISFITPNKKASDYLDKLLWEHPSESFLPHRLEGSTLPAFIQICEKPVFDGETTSFFNLTKEPLDPPFGLCKIYEIEETKSPEKKKIFESKYKYYSQRNYHLISL